MANLVHKLRASADRALVYAPLRTRLAATAGSADMRALHHLANGLAFRRRHVALRRLAYTVEAVSWPLTCWILQRRQDPALVAQAARHAGVSVATYLRRQWFSCVRHQMPPFDYLRLALHLDERRTRPGGWLFDIENYRLVGRLLEGVDISVLSDKLKFRNRCAAQDIPTVDVFAVLNRGHVEWLLDPASVRWRCDLIVKPQGQKSGMNISRWEWREAGYYQGPNGKSQTLEDLLSTLSRQARTAYLVQPRVRNDEQTCAYTNGALSTMRITTGRFASGRIAPVAAFFKMAVGQAVVDNFSAGGLAAPVDVETGKLSTAIRRSDPFTPLAAHPDTGGVFAETTAAQWDEMVKLSLRAHAAFPEFVFVAWDLAATPDGPIIIEANHMGDTIEFQGVNGRPMEQTLFAAVCVSHLAPRAAAAA